MLAELGFTPPPKKNTCAQSGLGQPGQPRGSSSPHLPAARGWCGNSCARGPAPAHWGLPAATTATCQGWRDPPQHHHPPAPAPRAVHGASARGLTGGRLTSQYACSWQSMTMRSPFRRCLAALSVAKAAPVPRPRRFSWTAAAPASAQPHPCPHPSAVSALHSPELLPRLHDHEVPCVVDPLVQEVVVVLGSSGQVATASHPCPALPWPWDPQHGDHCTGCSGEHRPLLGELSPSPAHHTREPCRRPGRRAPLTFSCSIRSPCLRMFFFAR